MSPGELNQANGGLIAGRFRVERKLGSGGMGQVLLCTDEKMDRLVAVKLLPLDAPGLSVKRFHVEAKALAKANHPNVLKVIDFGQAEDSRLYLIMEYLEGVPLSEVIDEKGAMPLSQAMDILVQIGRGLQYAHSHAILHRDIKPSNIMLVRDKKGDLVAKLVDFGMAKLLETDQFLTKTGTSLGTPTYMSPESVDGKPLDERSDIYSFGILMFELLAGTPPFMAATSRDTMFLHIDAPVPSLFELSDKEFPEAVENIVQKCLKKNPEERYQTVKGLLRDLEYYADPNHQVIREETVVEQPLPTKAQKKRLPPYVVPLITLIVLGCVGYVFVMQANLQGSERSKDKPLYKHRLVADLEPPKDEVTDETLDRLAKDNMAPKIFTARDELDKQLYCQVSGEVTDGQLKQAAQKYSHLKNFRFYRTPLIANGLKYIVHLPIVDLQLDQTPITNADYATIADITTIRKLRLNNSIQVTAADLQELLALKHLESFDIKCVGSMNNHFEVFSQMHSLNELILEQYQIKKNELRKLAKNESLRSLALEGCEIPDSSYLELLDLKKLERVAIVGGKVDVYVVGHLAKLKKLKRLQISTEQISDYAVSNLQKMKWLDELDLRGTNISSRMYTMLQDGLPSTKILTGEIPI